MISQFEFFLELNSQVIKRNSACLSISKPGCVMIEILSMNMDLRYAKSIVPCCLSVLFDGLQICKLYSTNCLFTCAFVCYLILLWSQVRYLVSRLQSRKCILIKFRLFHLQNVKFYCLFSIYFLGWGLNSEPGSKTAFFGKIGPVFTLTRMYERD